MPRRPRNIHPGNGYSLVELLAVIVIVGILASVAVSSLSRSVETARVEKTKQELNELAAAICGDARLLSNDGRVDFGYVGDVGALPANLDALVSNPGYATWKGPYIHDDFHSSEGSPDYEFKLDEWGKPYTFAGNTLTSTGSGSPIVKKIARSIPDLVSNTVMVVIVDLDQSPPGASFRDSVQVNLVYPDGAGELVGANIVPEPDGVAAFSNVPVGRHNLRVIYTPENDTLVRRITVYPGDTAYLELSLYDNYW